MTVEEKQAVLALIDECKEVIEKNFNRPGTTSGSMSVWRPGRR